MRAIKLSLLLLWISLGLLAVPAWSKPDEAHWVPSWYASPVPNAKAEVKVTDQTLRQIVRISAGGTSLRIRLSNAYGTEPLRIDDIRVAKRLSGSRIDTRADYAVTFQGREGVTIAPGAYVLSDAVPLSVANDSDVAISLYVAAATPVSTYHDIQRGALYIKAGKATQAESLPEGSVDLGIGKSMPWLAEVEVAATPKTRTLVTFGDSITDGYGIKPDKGATWPEVLSRRLHETGLGYSVVNAGISGNRLLHHGTWGPFGTGGLARFDRDVLAQPHVSDVIVLIGINDLGHAAGPESAQYVSAESIIDGYSQLAARAHEKGIRIYGATLTPFKGTVFDGYYSDEKETRRLIINAWLRTNKAMDGVVDFDAALEAPGKPGYLRSELDTGDHLHPNTAGASVMGNAVPLKLFAEPEKVP